MGFLARIIDVLLEIVGFLARNIGFMQQLYRKNMRF